jgi:glycosyltransferase involved in cell wall biosynthesis
VKPLVTIGICVKNNEATIQESITSVIDQDFPHSLMEIIVVDGSSRDKTVSILKEMISNSAIAALFFSESQGLAFARQIVVSKAKGKYILWVDGDVILSKTYVREQESFMENNPHAAVAVGKIGILQNANWVALLESISYVVESLKNDGNATSKLLGTRGSIFRVKAIRQVGGFDIEYTSHEDTDLAYRLMLAGWQFFLTEDIWKRHVWYGYGLHFLNHKHKEMNIYASKTNDRIIISFQAYRLTHRKVVFLLPVSFLFRKIALGFGFLKAHINGYGHK